MIWRAFSWYSIMVRDADKASSQLAPAYLVKRKYGNHNSAKNGPTSPPREVQHMDLNRDMGRNFSLSWHLLWDHNAESAQGHFLSVARWWWFTSSDCD